MLYTVPNATFIETPAGDSGVVTINDTSGSIATLQSSINSARSANPASIIVINLKGGAAYSVSNASLTLGSQECLVSAGAIIRAANSSVTVPLIQITSGSTNVSVSGGILDGNGANINGITGTSLARVNIDHVIVQNCGLDCIFLKGNGNTTFDNEMTVTRCDCSRSPAHAGISIQNATQAICLDNNCHGNLDGIYLTAAYSTVVNNTCAYNGTGIYVAAGFENNIANNTCNQNGTGIYEADTNTFVASGSFANNSVAGIISAGNDNFFVDNLFNAGNATNFLSGGTGNYVVAYQAPLSAPGQNYFYPPLVSNPHTNTTIVNGLGRTDITVGSTNMEGIQAQYNLARAANPQNVIVLHLPGSYTVGTNSLQLRSNTCVLLTGTIQINASTIASAAIIATNSSQRNISISGGIIDGGNLTGNNALYITGATDVQVDGMTLQNFGPDNPRAGGSDVMHFSGGGAPCIITRCFVNGGAARGIWTQNSGVRALVSDNVVTAVNQDGVDCDSGTSGALVKFNTLTNLVRYGVFFEQRDKYDVAVGNICNFCGRDINVYNNDEPGSPTEYNCDICNSCLGGANGIRSGSTGITGGSDSTNTLTSHNFFFNNVVQSSTGDGIEGDQAGTENYYSQNYLAANSTAITTSGSESFFNPPCDTTNQYVQDSNSRLFAVVSGASTANNANIITSPTNTLGSDQWALQPTDGGYYRIMNRHSGKAMVVLSASKIPGALIIQFTYNASGNDEWMPQPCGNGLYNLVNRWSDLYLDVPRGSLTSGTQLDQQVPNGNASQQFNLNDFVVPAISNLTLSSFSLANGTNLVIGGTNSGIGTFFVLAATNPSGNWTPITTNQLAGSGSFTLITTNGANPKLVPQQFYRLGTTNN